MENSKMKAMRKVFNENNYYAKLQINAEGILIIDWCNGKDPNHHKVGTRNQDRYVIRYIVNQDNGVLIMDGAFGFAIAEWGKSMTLPEFCERADDICVFAAHHTYDRGDHSARMEARAVGLQMAYEQIARDGQLSVKTVRIRLDHGKFLTAEATHLSDYKEIYIGIEQDGIWKQNLGIIRERYENPKKTDQVVPLSGQYEVLVYEDPNEEDYTKKFRIPEREGVKP